MSTVVVCLRSRLLSEAVADLIESSSDLRAVPSQPAGVVSTISAAEPVCGLLVDGETAGRIDDPAGCPVVVLGRRDQDAAGLTGVVTNLPIDVGSAHLIDILRRVSAGELEAQERRGAAPSRGRRAGDRTEWLTPRESEVLELIAAASSPAEIAAALDVSEHTVRTHVQNLLAKLGATSKVDAVARARSLGLLDSGRVR